MLAAELAAGKSERLCAVLDFACHFHRYSLGNQTLIQAACPAATYVAGYHTWQKLGYQLLTVVARWVTAHRPPTSDALTRA